MNDRRYFLSASVASAVMILVLTMYVMSAWAAGSDIVISEVMYNAALESGDGDGEWVEICNKGTVSVDLVGWQIRDNHVTETITSDMCFEGSCMIPAEACWLVARSQSHLQDEFNTYTNPLSPTVQTTSTIFLDGSIGNGLSNSEDNVILRNSSGDNIDCVSWANMTGTVCTDLTYVIGGGGSDTNLDGAGDGQAITNIGGTWYEHEVNASPYSSVNTAEGGSPTAITLLFLIARGRTDVEYRSAAGEIPRHLSIGLAMAASVVGLAAAATFRNWLET